MSEDEKYTIEEINAFREEVYKHLILLGQDDDFARSISGFENMIIRGGLGEDDHKASHEEAVSVWSEIMNYNTPQFYAEIMCM